MDFLDSDKEVNSTRLLHNQTLILSKLHKYIVSYICLNNQTFYQKVY